MNTFTAVAFLVMFLYLLVQFARQEWIEDEYKDTIVDIEGRLDWAWTRTTFPFGMKSQLEVSRELLGEAKNLWQANRWHQAYRVALESQEAMNKAQNIYSLVIRKSRSTLN